MKNWLTVISLTLTISSIAQRQIWGTTSNGGSGDGGVIFQYDKTNSTIINHYNFYNNNGSNPKKTKLCKASNGNLYGMTSNGGVCGHGNLFEYNPQTNTFKELLEFEENLGTGGTSAGTEGSLILANNNILYGVTRKGGQFGNGTLFEYNPITAQYTKLLDFEHDSTGSHPTDNLVQSSNGLIYGVTTDGGQYGGSSQNNNGILFSFDINTNTYQRLLDFNYSGGITGSSPLSGLIEASNGKLYLITGSGLISNGSAIVEYNITNNIAQVVWEFTTSNPQNGYWGRSTLVEGDSLKLYGVNWAGGNNNGGTIYSYNIANGSCSALFHFDSLTGLYPRGRLEWHQGKLYGMTEEGGIYGKGTFYSYNPGNDSLTVILNFNGENGEYPNGGVTSVDSSTIYGLTSTGGIGNSGTIFKFNSQNSTFKKKIDINHDSIGNKPFGGVEYVDRNLYGTTSNGGKYGYGGLYQYSIDSSGLNHLFYFSDSAGYSQYHSPLLLGNRVYGALTYGGSNGLGTLYEYDFTNNDSKLLVNFNGVNGKNPYSNLIRLSNSEIIGLTSTGGVNDNGCIFKYDLSQDSLFLIYEFSMDSLGKNPLGEFHHDSVNNLIIGTTSGGGLNGKGVLYKYNLVTNIYSVIMDLPSNIQAISNGIKVINDSLIIGTSFFGGTGGSGFLFKIDTISKQLTTLHNFVGNRFSPYHNPILSSDDSLLLGAAHPNCSLNDKGFIYSYNVYSDVFKKEFLFNDTLGEVPYILSEICIKPDYSIISDNVYCNQDSIYIEISSSNTEFYQWKINGSNLANEISSTLLIQGVTSSELGTYTLEMTNECGTTIKDFVVTSCIGLNEVLSFGLSIYPNPFTSSTNIEIKNLKGQQANLQLTDILGRSVWNHTTTKNQTILDGSFLPKGIYNLNVQVGDKNIFRKLVIQ